MIDITTIFIYSVLIGTFIGAFISLWIKKHISSWKSTKVIAPYVTTTYTCNSINNRVYNGDDIVS
jgi:hypothetical protein